MPIHRLQAPLAHLESLLVHAEHAPGSSTFGPALEAFLSLVEREGLEACGEAVVEPILATSVALALRAAFGKAPPQQHVAVFRVPGLGFAHGTVWMPDSPAAWFWFDRCQRGLVAAWDPAERTTHMIRLTLAHAGPSGPAQA